MSYHTQLELRKSQEVLSCVNIVKKNVIIQGDASLIIYYYKINAKQQTTNLDNYQHISNVQKVGYVVDTLQSSDINDLLSFCY